MLNILLGTVIALVTAVLFTVLYLAWLTRRIARNAEKAVPAIGAFIEVEGERIHYVESGEGPAILMVHGLGGTLHHMHRPLMEGFGEGYRLVAIDRGGSGYSTRLPGCDGSLDEQARLIRGVIDAFGLEKPLLVGHSLGGAIALATALDFPEKVSGLALISPLTRFEAHLPREFKLLNIASPWLRWLMANTVALPMSIKSSPAILDLVFGPQRPPPDYAIEGGAMGALRPSHFYATSTDLVGSRRDIAQYETRYGELSMPVGILFGTQDRLLNYERQGVVMAEQIEGLDLELVNGVGHMPQYSQSDQVNEFIRRIAARAFASALEKK